MTVAGAGQARFVSGAARAVLHSAAEALRTAGLWDRSRRISPRDISDVTHIAMAMAARGALDPRSMELPFAVVALLAKSQIEQRCLMAHFSGPSANSYIGNTEVSPFASPDVVKHTPEPTGEERTDTNFKRDPATEQSEADNLPEGWHPWTLWREWLARLWQTIIGTERRVELVASKLAGSAPHLSLSTDIAGLIAVNAAADRRVATNLMTRVRGTSRHLNVVQTLHATFHNEGLFTPQWAERTFPVDYVLLAHRASPLDLEFMRVTRMVARLHASGVRATLYAYSGSPLISRLVHSHGGLGEVVTLRELVDRHASARLALLTDGSELVEPLHHLPYEWTKFLRHWPSRAMLTPLEQCDWDERELAITSKLGFCLVHSGTDLHVALARGFAPHRRSRETISAVRAHTSPEFVTHPELQLVSIAPPSLDEQTQMLRDLRRHLGPDAFEWLALCVLYPRPEPALVLTLGMMFGSPRTGRPVFSEERLARLASLPWMRRGRFPRWFRHLIFDSLDRSRKRKLVAFFTNFMADARLTAHSGVSDVTLAFEALATGAGQTLLQLPLRGNIAPAGGQLGVDGVTARMIARNATRSQIDTVIRLAAPQAQMPSQHKAPAPFPTSRQHEPVSKLAGSSVADENASSSAPIIAVSQALSDRNREAAELLWASLQDSGYTLNWLPVTGARNGGDGGHADSIRDQRIDEANVVIGARDSETRLRRSQSSTDYYSQTSDDLDDSGAKAISIWFGLHAPDDAINFLDWSGDKSAPAWATLIQRIEDIQNSDAAQSGSSRIVLSYARRDGQTAADALRSRLADPAFTAGRALAVSNELTSLRSGKWRDQLRASIMACDHLLIVVTPDALASEVCAQEWHVARIEGTEISPVLVDSALRPEDLPKWMRAQHIYRFDLDASGLAKEVEWQRLVTALRAPKRGRRMPVIPREPSDRFLARPTEMKALREMLLDANGDPIGVTTVLTGAGGMGKTQLALAVARDPQIQSAFYDGQLLIQLGQRPNLVMVLNTAIRELNGETIAAQSVSEAATGLAKALSNRCVLLVIDDVWESAHLEPFLLDQSAPEQGRCARLVTTRNVELLPGTQHKQVNVGEMSPEQALALLEAGLPAVQLPSMRHRLVALVKHLGHNAQAIDLVRGRIESRILDGWPLASALDDAETLYAAHGVDAFNHSSSSAREDSYARTISASVDLLTTEQKARFLELAIFPEDTDVPYDTVALLWANVAGMTESDAAALLDRLGRMSLVKSFVERDTRAIRLHDVIRTYLRESNQQSPEQLTELNRRLWSAHVQAGERAFADGTALAHYSYEKMPWHLNEANEPEILERLLLDPKWITAKLAAVGELDALLLDYQRYAQGKLSIQIRQTLELDEDIIARDRTQLLPQLIKRLSSETSDQAQSFVTQARSLISEATDHDRSLAAKQVLVHSEFSEASAHAIIGLAALGDDRLVSASTDGEIRLWHSIGRRQLSSRIADKLGARTLVALDDGSIAVGSRDIIFFRFDGNEILETDRIKVRYGPIIFSLAALPKGRLASVERGSLIRIWDRRSGNLVSDLDCGSSSISCLLALPTGQLAAASSDGSIRLWEPTAGVEIARFIGHTHTVMALAILPDGRLISASEDKTVRMWDSTTGIETSRLEGHSGPVSSLVILPDGRIASASNDGEIRIWAPATGMVTASFQLNSAVTSMAARADGRLVAGTANGRLHWLSFPTSA